jgi:hypothetical protein
MCAECGPPCNWILYGSKIIFEVELDPQGQGDVEIDVPESQPTNTSFISSIKF